MSDKFTVEPLPYDYDALEPHIDEETMRLHHGKHHAAYVSKLNAALDTHPELFETEIDGLLADLDSIPQDIRTAVRNHGGGASNHAKFWQWMTPETTAPSEELLAALQDSFGDLDGFKEKFAAAAMGQFGSGWAWLVVVGGKLEIMSTPNQDTPISQGMTPILGLDVWEHSYYVHYRNDRAAYISAWWNVVNWDKVSEDFKNSAQ